MSDFVVRVELHYASEADYANLHRKMEQVGYSRFVHGADGKMYQLPTATYVRNIPGFTTAAQIRDHVHSIASTIDQGAWVLANRYDDSAWWLSPRSSASAA